MSVLTKSSVIDFNLKKTSLLKILIKKTTTMKVKKLSLCCPKTALNCISETNITDVVSNFRP